MFKWENLLALPGSHSPESFPTFPNKFGTTAACNDVDSGVQEAPEAHRLAGLRWIRIRGAGLSLRNANQRFSKGRSNLPNLPNLHGASGHQYFHDVMLCKLSPLASKMTCSQIDAILWDFDTRLEIESKQEREETWRF